MDFLVRDFRREGFFKRLEAVHAQLAANGGDLVVAFGGQPAGLELDLASFDQIGDERDDGAEGSSADLGDFPEGAAFL